MIGQATVGERVARYRRRRGISQEVLAGLLGRSVEWLAQFERGAKELDRLSTLVAIADALGIEPVTLLPAAFFTRRRELHDVVIGTAPDSVPAIKSAMFRYSAAARLLGRELLETGLPIVLISLLGVRIAVSYAFFDRRRVLVTGRSRPRRLRPWRRPRDVRHVNCCCVLARGGWYRCGTIGSIASQRRTGSRPGAAVPSIDGFLGVRYPSAPSPADGGHRDNPHSLVMW